MTAQAKAIRDAMLAGEDKKPKRFLPTGSTLLNMACSDRPNGGYPVGKYILKVGDSESGKTWLSLTSMAEACQREAFKDYRLIFDDPEDGAMMDKAKFFGKELAKRIEPPSGTRKKPGVSETAEQFYFHLDDAFNYGQPFIYLLDSENSLTTDADIKKFKSHKAAAEAGEDDAGSFGVTKAKLHSRNLGRVRSRLAQHGCILIILSQTRDRIGFGAQFDPKTRSGGRALKFWADLELWLSIRSNITKTIMGKKRQLGIQSLIKIKKNRINGKKREVVVPIYNTFGVDDVGSMVDYLCEEGAWSANKAKSGDWSGIEAPQFGKKPFSREKLIQHIESVNGEKELQSAVVDCWNEIEAACTVQRKARYK